MQIKFLQTSTALAWLAGVITSNEVMKFECHAMLNNQGYTYEEERRHRSFQALERERTNQRMKQEQDKESAENQKKAFRDALREHEQEQRNSRYQQAVRTGQFTDDAEGQEFKEIYERQQAQEKEEREKRKKLKQKDEEEKDRVKFEAPLCMKKYNDKLSTFDQSDRELWEEWDKERNWREYCDTLTSDVGRAYRLNAYDPEYYYHYIKPKKTVPVHLGRLTIFCKGAYWRKTDSRI
ncbi:MAG: hypothetical protein BGO67_01085 [Alphaproteobacteria bacterium 41-28]|nr:MAG: hypothetical protein BGO67_01085 [Alphaproteobacteria bacterium 41-28]